MVLVLTLYNTLSQPFTPTQTVAVINSTLPGPSPQVVQTVLVSPSTDASGALITTIPISTVAVLPTNTAPPLNQGATSSPITSNAQNVESSASTSLSSSSAPTGLSSPSSSTTSAGISVSPSSSSLIASQPGSQTSDATPRSIRIITETVTASPGTQTAISSKNRLPNGTVAGIVIAAAIGLAFITFLLTFLFMRRRKDTVSSSQQSDSSAFGTSKAIQQSQQSSQSERKEPFLMASTKHAGDTPAYLPQSADDSTIQRRVSTLIDQLDLHVENFYLDEGKPEARKIDKDIRLFETSRLPKSLPDCLSQISGSRLLIKHALAHYTTSAISANDRDTSNLLPDEFTGLPRSSFSAKIKGLSKPGISLTSLQLIFMIWNKLIRARCR